MTATAQRWVLASRPGAVLEPGHFRFESFPSPQPQADGDVLVRVEYHTVSPGARARLQLISYAAMTQPGEVVPASGVGVVEASRHPDFAVGDRVAGEFGMVSHAVVPGAELFPLEPELYGNDIPAYASITALGVNGLTAYIGMLRIGRAQPGETVLVSSAAGTVGSMASQIAHILGCDVVGIAGSAAKCEDLVAHLGCTDAINYNSEPDLAQAIRRVRPDGIDVFFDNVGGRTLDAGVQNLRNFGRVAICGRLADYAEGVAEVRDLSPSRRLTLQSFVVWDYAKEFPQAKAQLAAWIREGKLKDEPAIVHGLENSIPAFIGLFERGATTARPLVKVA